MDAILAPLETTRFAKGAEYGPVFPWPNLPFKQGDHAGRIPSCPSDPSPVREGGLAQWDYILGAGETDAQHGQQVGHRNNAVPPTGRFNHYWMADCKSKFFRGEKRTFKHSVHLDDTAEDQGMRIVETAHALAHIDALFDPAPSDQKKSLGSSSRLFVWWVAALSAARLYGLELRVPEYGRYEPPFIDRLSHFVWVDPTLRLGFSENTPVLSLPADPMLTDRVSVVLGACVEIGDNPTTFKNPFEKTVEWDDWFSYQPTAVHFYGCHSAAHLAMCAKFYPERFSFERSKRKKPFVFGEHAAGSFEPAHMSRLVSEADDHWRRQAKGTWLDFDRFLNACEPLVRQTPPLPCKECFLLNPAAREKPPVPHGARPEDWKDSEWAELSFELARLMATVRKAKKLALENPKGYTTLCGAANRAYRNLRKNRRDQIREKRRRS